jgi:hypothetical protein
MKASSTVKPNKVSDDFRLATNITKVIREGDLIYEYEEFQLEAAVPKETVEADFAMYLAQAKAQESKRIEQNYKTMTQRMIREQYSSHDELKLTNDALLSVMSGETPGVEYISYRHHVEECKIKAAELALE